MKNLFSFPNPVNEMASRVVAAGVASMAITTLITRQYWVLIPIAYGFVARVAAGPRFSPLGLFATRIAAPCLSERPVLVPGPPKRFAQGIGAGLAITALIAHYGLSATALTNILLLALTVAATLEALLALCIGCAMFNALMKLNLIPERICVECANITARPPQPLPVNTENSGGLGT